jgi:FkbH-like protein
VSQAVTIPSPIASDLLGRLKELALGGTPEFHTALRRATLAAGSAEDVLLLSSLRRKAARRGLVRDQKPLRVAMLGGSTMFPLHELTEHFLTAAPRAASIAPEFLLGDFDNYISEIVDAGSRLYQFGPEVIVLLPSIRRCRYSGRLFDSRERPQTEARTIAADILELCTAANQRTGAEIVLANFPLPSGFDPGTYRTRTVASDWSFRKVVNLELGLSAPPYVHICDVEFLSARRGTVEAWEPRAWFESKQLYGRGLMLDVAREVAHIIENLRESPKKMAILDLDNTLWGGVVGDDGLGGIEIGDTSPRGEAFKAFQQYLALLTERGVLLAVCSKNDYEKAVEPFENHPEMVLHMKDFVCFKANWQPKSENIRQIAAELNLGLDSMVFIDDNPAEIEIVRQFVPEVEGILLPPDPAEYIAAVQNSRFFEPHNLTAEDSARVRQYQQEAERQTVLSAVTDMDAYLESLAMQAVIREFRPMDVPRISQLINKSNQFNLTTRRRTEAQVEAVMADPAMLGFTVRLADRFGDYGLISIVVGSVAGEELVIDTWLMSCRVLKRQVEEEVLNEIVRLARTHNAARIRGIYLPTAKNAMVRDHYPTLGFTAVPETAERREFVLEVGSYQPRPTRIRVLETSYDAK